MNAHRRETTLVEDRFPGGCTVEVIILQRQFGSR
jgi:hypothetical protein